MMAIPVLRDVLHGAPLPLPVAIAVGGSSRACHRAGMAWPEPVALCLSGGLWRPGASPTAMDLPLGNVAVWLFVLAVVIGGFADRRAGRATPATCASTLLRAVPVVVVLSLLGTAVFTVAMFTAAARQGLTCRLDLGAKPGRPVRGAVWRGRGDPRPGPRHRKPATARWTPYRPPPRPVGSSRAQGFAPGEPPATRAQVWGSLVARGGRTAESTLGQMDTGGTACRARLADGAMVTVLGAGTLSDGNTLTAVYGTLVGGRVTELGRQQLTDTARDPAWRTLILRPPTGADVVRLKAVDGTTFIHGWLGFSAPEIQRPVTLSSYIPPGAPVAVNWQIAFDYPCLRQPRRGRRHHRARRLRRRLGQPVAQRPVGRNLDTRPRRPLRSNPPQPVRPAARHGGRHRSHRPGVSAQLAPRPRRLHRDHDDARPGRCGDGERAGPPVE